MNPARNDNRTFIKTEQEPTRAGFPRRLCRLSAAALNKLKLKLCLPCAFPSNLKGINYEVDTGQPDCFFKILGIAAAQHRGGRHRRVTPGSKASPTGLYKQFDTSHDYPVR